MASPSQPPKEPPTCTILDSATMENTNSTNSLPKASGSADTSLDTTTALSQNSTQEPRVSSETRLVQKRITHEAVEEVENIERLSCNDHNLRPQPYMSSRHQQDQQRHLHHHQAATYQNSNRASSTLFSNRVRIPTPHLQATKLVPDMASQPRSRDPHGFYQQGKFSFICNHNGSFFRYHKCEAGGSFRSLAFLSSLPHRCHFVIDS